MKQWLLLLLLCGLLAGCAAPPADREPVGSDAPSAPPPAASEPAEEAPCTYAVEMRELEYNTLDRDGTHLVEYRVHFPVLTARRSDGVGITDETAVTDAERRALAVAEAFNAEFAYGGDADRLTELDQAALEDRAWRQEEGIDFSPYSMELDFQAYQTDRLVSVTGSYYSYTGGAHPNTVLAAWNFDLETGAFFAPEQLSEDGQAFTRAVQEEIVRQLRERAEENGLAAEEMFWSNYEEIAAGWSSYAVSFDEAGMTVGFSPYELAAYAAGSQSFQIPYDFLAPYLGDYGRGVLGLE